jgi:hypothetical protein
MTLTVRRVAVPALVATLLLAVGAVGILRATNADAATGCTGKLIDSSYSPVAELDLYWDASRGVNCAKVVHLGAAYGVTAGTAVELDECAETKPGPTCTPIKIGSDPAYGSNWRKTGLYKYYAGPVTVPGRAGATASKPAGGWSGRASRKPWRRA